jgi:AcrR family transcriptional regulator
MPKNRLQPRKSPSQARSRETVKAILDAAARVLARDSLVGFNTNRVAETAGVSVGSLYQYFPSKDALCAALIERAHADLRAAIEAVVSESEGRPLEFAVRALVRLAIRQQYTEPLLAAALDHEERRLPLGPRLRESERQLVESVQRLLTRHRRELAASLPRQAAQDCLAIARALVEADIDAPGGPAANLEARLMRALLGYLRSP